MSDRNPLSPGLFEELQVLTDASLRGDPSPEQMARLEKLLRGTAAMDAYLDMVWESDTLATWAKLSEQEKLAAARHDAFLRGAARVRLLGFLHLALRYAGRVVARHPVAAAALALVAVVPLVAWLASTPSPQVAADGGRNRAARPSETGPDKASGEAANEDSDNESSPLPRRRVVNPVARLARAVDCAWESSRDAPEAGDDMAAGQKLVLKSGLAEIVFQAGARTILQGPATLEVRSRASAALNRGKCTVTVENPLARGFEIHAPGMKYTDLGTEFGVVVAENGVQEAHVFRGKVQAEQGNDTENRRKGEGENAKSPPLPFSSSPPLVLTAHEALRVPVPDAAGKPVKPIEHIAADEKQFVRALPPATALDLVDIVAGGDGLSARGNRGINPTNGRFSDEPGGRDNIVQEKGTVFRADHRYHRVPGSPLIDGVFIVHGGRGPVQLDSAGHSFAGFPGNDGKTANMIRAVRATAANPATIFGAKQNNLPQWGGVDYSSIGHGVLSMRGNKGITFDLAAIRAAHPRYRLLSFAAVAGNSCRTIIQTHLGDFWVFVDGQLRFQKLGVSVENGVVPIDVPLRQTDRHLTLVATTTTPSGIWNWTMFGDPLLKLAASETPPTDTNKTK